MTRDDDDPRDETDVVIELVSASRDHLAAKLRQPPHMLLARRLAWPAYDGFLPARLVDGTLDDLESLHYHSWGSDGALRLGFSASGSPASYYPTEEMRTHGSRRSRDPERDAFVQDVARFDWPLFSIEELADLTAAFTDHLLSNKAHILETGFPRSQFKGSKWLHSHFSALYFTKIPAYVLNHIDGSSGESEYTYLWPAQVGESLRLPKHATDLHAAFGTGPCFWYDSDWKAYTRDGTLVRLVPYDQAALIEGLSPDTADKLALRRGALLNLRLEILQELLYAARRRNPASLRHTCLGILTDRLSAEDVDFHTRLDMSYYMPRFPACYFTVNYFLNSSAFLWSTFMMIGHYEAELTIGRLARTRSALDGLIQCDDQGCPICWVDRYDDIIGCPEQKLIDSAHAVFHGSADAEHRFWSNDFMPWLGAAFGEFYSSFFGTRVRKKHAVSLREYMENQVRFAAAALELTGGLPKVELGQLQVGSRPDENVFRRDGQQWSVVCNGQHMSLNESDGATYIGYLLVHPDEPFHVRELYIIAHRGQEDPQIVKLDDIAYEERQQFGLDEERSDTDKRDDAKLLRTYREAMRNLQSECDRAVADKHRDEAERLREELTELRRVFSSEFGQDGQMRRKDDPNKKAYDRVSKAIARVMRVIDREHPALHRHLTNAIHYETFMYRYSPDHPVVWNT